MRVGAGKECDPTLTGFREYVCTRDGTRVTVPRVCKNEKACPRCSKLWAWGEAKRAVWRMRHVAKLLQRRAPPRHVVVSFDTFVVPYTFDEAMRRGREVLLKMGVIGGCLVYHPWRHAGAEEWWAGPHVHAIVWGAVDAMKRPVGVVVKTLRPAQGSYVGTLAYVLNHAGYVSRKHSLRWFGAAAYSKVPKGTVPKPPRSEGPRCPICGGPMEDVRGIFDVTAGGTGGRWIK